eukprot:TRINITY_DN7047_c1_g6_i1.p1 TRINITY_DN7047_c1_g6~~TRINITY_DN7047_c1_g6_i1.p1  ORF type:complete len:418 (-),score=32.91 TRINITY_DN7047_c1_g6_i1:246-1418(-)
MAMHLAGTHAFDSGQRHFTTPARTGLHVSDQQIIGNTLSLFITGPYSDTYSQQCMPQADDISEFERYAEFHGECRTDPDCLSRALVWQCDDSDVCGGLGDEVRGLATTMYVAMATKRPFFVIWKRMGNDMLNLLTANRIDVRAPDSISDCPHRRIIDSHDYETVWKQMASTEGCTIWTTNAQVSQFVEKQVLQKHYPVMEHVKPETAVGCSMNYLFSPWRMTAADWAQYAVLPEDFVAIHARCDDDEFRLGGRAAGNLRREVDQAFECAKSMDAQNVAFVSCSPSAKQFAKEASENLRGSMRIFVSGSEARHIDHDHKTLTSTEFSAAVLSDFAVLQQAKALIWAGRPSGFSEIAVSMGLMPKDKMFEVHVDKPCVPTTRYKRSFMRRFG